MARRRRLLGSGGGGPLGGASGSGEDGFGGETPAGEPSSAAPNVDFVGPSPTPVPLGDAELAPEGESFVSYTAPAGAPTDQLGAFDPLDPGAAPGPAPSTGGLSALARARARGGATGASSAAPVPAVPVPAVPSQADSFVSGLEAPPGVDDFDPLGLFDDPSPHAPSHPAVSGTQDALDPADFDDHEAPTEESEYSHTPMPAPRRVAAPEEQDTVIGRAPQAPAPSSVPGADYVSPESAYVSMGTSHSDTTDSGWHDSVFDAPTAPSPALVSARASAARPAAPRAPRIETPDDDASPIERARAGANLQQRGRARPVQPIQPIQPAGADAGLPFFGADDLLGGAPPAPPPLPGRPAASPFADAPSPVGFGAGGPADPMRDPPTEEVPSAVLEDLSQLYDATLGSAGGARAGRGTPASGVPTYLPSPQPEASAPPPHAGPRTAPPANPVAYDADDDDDDDAPHAEALPVGRILVAVGVGALLVGGLFVGGLLAIGAITVGAPERVFPVLSDATPPVAPPEPTATGEPPVERPAAPSEPVADAPEAAAASEPGEAVVAPAAPVPAAAPASPPAAPVPSAPAPKATTAPKNAPPKAAPAERKPPPAAPPAEPAKGGNGTVKVRANTRVLVLVDGQVVDYTPLDLPVSAGAHTVSAMLPGRPGSKQDQKVTIKAGKTESVQFSF